MNKSKVTIYKPNYNALEKKNLVTNFQKKAKAADAQGFSLKKT
jgi:hypothetical protein